MPPTVVLSVGVDYSVLARQRPVWQSAGCYVTSAGSIREAIVQLRDGDFDLILLGHSIPIESRERLTFLIRASRSQIPVVCVTDSPGGLDSSADVTICDEPGNLLQVIGELLAKRVNTHTAIQPCETR